MCTMLLPGGLLPTLLLMRERVSPVISGALIVGGIALTVAGARTRPSGK